jgi:hypothetical protein
MPFGETLLGYVEVHAKYLEDLARQQPGAVSAARPVDIVLRYRYNPSLKVSMPWCRAFRPFFSS